MIKAEYQNNVDNARFGWLREAAEVEIYVGFASGREHQATLHKDKKTKHKSYDGEEAAEEKPMDTAELARALHFGTATIPARPFLTDGIESKIDEISTEMKKQASQALKGMANWNKVGTMAVGAIQEFVRGDYYRSNIPNSKKTIDYKESDTPLIDGADMINALSYIVKETGKKVM